MPPKFTNMDTPSTRADFEERLNVLREHMRLGKLKFAAGLHAPESMMKVRHLPNGRIDMLSIDESARLEANMIYNMARGEMGRMVSKAMDDADEPEAEGDDEDKGV